jgi:transcriptional regulator with XRE-family HTH domain
VSIYKSSMPPKKSNKGTDTLPFSSILRSIMNERQLSAKQLAEMSGVKATVVQNWLEGKNPHDLKAVDKLAKSLGVSFRSLLLGEAESVKGPQSIGEMFDEQEFFDGLAKISIKRLVPRTKGEI